LCCRYRNPAGYDTSVSCITADATITNTTITFARQQDLELCNR
jgi:hypothetical protein